MKTVAKSLICHHKRTKPKLVIEARRDRITGHFQGTTMKLCCADCGSQVPQTKQYLERQVA